MKPVTIYHNAKCSKSRATLKLLRDKGIEPTVVEYLTSPPTQAALRKIVKTLGIPAAALIRTKEYSALGFRQTNDEAQLIRLMSKHPAIMQRPIVISGDNACLGRPPENVLKIL